MPFVDVGVLERVYCRIPTCYSIVRFASSCCHASVRNTQKRRYSQTSLKLSSRGLYRGQSRIVYDRRHLVPYASGVTMIDVYTALTSSPRKEISYVE